MGAHPSGRTRPGARPIPGPRPAAHPRHPRAGGRGDGRELGPDPQERARRAGRDDHRRLQQGARPDERDGPGTPRPGRRAGSTPRRAARQALRAGERRRDHLHRPVPRARQATGRERHHRHDPRHQPPRGRGPRHDQDQRARATRGGRRHQQVLRPQPRLRRARPQGPGPHDRDLGHPHRRAGRPTGRTPTSPSAAPASRPRST